ncbi:MAG: hypothetical protein KIS66_05365 [Fimbriimonadaceae bacterium]|nr:hypothetical protein [Fimbriimonadaceae bacterium]
MRALAGILLFVGLSGALASQMRQEWLNRYNGPLNDFDQAFAVSVDAAGNVVSTGGSTQSGTGVDIVTHKYSRAGTLLWTARYDGPGGVRDVGVGVGTDAAGNVYVLGTSYGGAATIDDWVIVKYNANGTQQWARRYGGTGSDLATGLYVDAATGACYATGAVVGTGFENFAVIKVASDGALVWDFQYDRAGGNDRGLAVQALPSGVCYATGSMTGSGTNTDYATVRLSATGSLLNIAFYNGPGNGPDEARDLVLDPSGNAYVTGWSRAVGLFDDMATVRYGATLNQVWVARYNGPANNDDWANAIARDPAGNILVTGASVASGSGRDLTTVLYSAAGVQSAVQRYNGPGNQADEGTDIAVDPVGNAYAIGTSVGSGTFKDFVLLKYAPGLVQQYLFRYNGPSSSDDTPWQVAVNAGGDVAVTGMSRGVSTFDDYTTLLYRQDFPLAGSVTLASFGGSPTGLPVRVWLSPPGGAEPTWSGQATLDAQGRFTLPCPYTGKVDVRVKVGHWLRRRVADVDFTTSGAAASFALINGDVNDDNSVNVADFVALRSAFGSSSGSPNWNPEADLNGNGSVNVTDFLILRANFGLSGD